jgi:hypothetical protein
MPEQSTLPTIVPVHGAFAEAAGWNGVIRGSHPVAIPEEPTAVELIRGAAADVA